MKFQKGDFIKIINVNRIRQGSYLWSNGDVVEVREVEEEAGRIEVWNREKTLSELIYIDEFKGIEKIKS
ncbi:hypothetical protein P9294_gp070 [Bacillus phage FADO]|uniref:Uncharacterized protein n=1 Tax=Bacillus phage FADO TaxID=2917160 RepID=A0AAE9GC42_9CAUD|nr:hypothetical protein P9294_gp070 [Bacillus phage FADO]UNY48785.1 hypothetical protein fado_70 [Bacillus phage FADO]